MKTDMKYIETKKEKFPFAYTLNVMEALQSEYGSLDEWANLIEPKEEGEPNLKALLFFFKEAINEGIEIENEESTTPRALIDNKKAGRIISEIGFDEAGKKLKDLVVDVGNETDSNEKN